jgi:transcriptional regulator with XRE-family HTH domain
MVGTQPSRLNPLDSQPKIPVVDFDHLARELVRALRGGRSQPALCRRLGLRSNAVYAWESGRRFPKASTFFRLAELRGGKLAPRLLALLELPSSELPELELAQPSGVARLLRLLAEERHTSELARAIGSDRSTVARWLRGDSEPRLPELLRVLDVTSVRLLDVVALLCDPALLPSTAEAHRNLAAQRRVAYALPVSHAVLRALELRGYRARPEHAPEYVAERLGLPRAEVEALIGALSASGQIALRGGRYEPTAVLTVDTGLDAEANLRLKQHWAELGLARLARTRGRGSGYFSYNLFAISERNYARARQLHAEYYERLRELVAKDRDPERVVLSNLQLFPLDE